MLDACLVCMASSLGQSVILWPRPPQYEQPTSPASTQSQLYRWVPVNLNMDNLNSWILQSPIETALLSLQWKSAHFSKFGLFQRMLLGITFFGVIGEVPVHQRMLDISLQPSNGMMGPGGACGQWALEPTTQHANFGTLTPGGAWGVKLIVNYHFFSHILCSKCTILKRKNSSARTEWRSCGAYMRTHSDTQEKKTFYDPYSLPGCSRPLGTSDLFLGTSDIVQATTSMHAKPSSFSRSF